MNTTTTIEPAADALILTGSGYDIQVGAAALAKRAEVIEAACRVMTVANNEDSAEAAFHVRQLAALRLETERCRKAIKEPVLAAGKRIDQAAKEYLCDIESEEQRLKGLIGQHAAEVARQRAEAEAVERKAADEARRAREAAEAAAQAAAESGRVADLIAAKQAEAERTETLAARCDAAEVTSAAKVADNVRFVWDFEVVDIYLLAKQHPDLVRIEPKRADILAELKEAEEGGAAMNPDTWAKEVGIRPFKKTVVSTR